MKNNKKDALSVVLRSIWHSLSHNLGYKVLSIVIAIFIWSYVIASNPSITRDKVITGLDVVVSGQSVLASRELALLTDLSTLTQARAYVRVAQSSYNSVTNENVRVEMDLSNIRTTGKQSVRLRGVTTYGTVVQVSPEYVEVEVETLAQRYVPVNVKITGETMDNYWYKITRTNPSQITVSGPISIVELASSAQVNLDMTGHTESHNRVEQMVVVDASGNELSTNLLSKSTSSVTVGVDIYPTKPVSVSTDIEQTLTGELPEGYLIDSVEIQPESIVVAAEQSLLDSLNELSVVPVDISDAKRSFTAIAKINKLSDIKYLSSDDVTVTVNIVEQDLTKRFSNVTPRLIGQSENMRTKWANPKLEVQVTGAYSIVESLSRSDLLCTVDLSGITESGVYELPISVSIDNYPELSYAVTPAVVKVTVTIN